MTNTFFPSSQAEHDYIVQRATSLGLDPEAVLAVAASEGGTLPSEVGDWSGTTGSYGPWQMRDPNLPGGGALPASVAARGPAFAEQWANSAAGIDYALSGIASAAKGLRGPQAVAAIVYGFEHPANPAGETATAQGTYAQGGGPGGSAAFGQWLLQNPAIARAIGTHGTPFYASIPGGSAVAGGVSTAVSDVGAALNAPKTAFEFLTSWRFAEVVGGALLLLLALWLIARQFGVAPAVPGLPSGSSSGDGSGAVRELEMQARAERAQASRDRAAASVEAARSRSRRDAMRAQEARYDAGAARRRRERARGVTRSEVADLQMFRS